MIKNVQREAKMKSTYAQLENKVCMNIAKVLYKPYFYFENKRRIKLKDGNSYNKEKIVKATYKELCKNIIDLDRLNHCVYLVNAKFLDTGINSAFVTPNKLMQYSNNKHVGKYCRWCVNNMFDMFIELHICAMDDPNVSVERVKPSDIFEPWQSGWSILNDKSILKLELKCDKDKNNEL